MQVTVPAVYDTWFETNLQTINTMYHYGKHSLKVRLKLILIIIGHQSKNGGC